MGKVKDFFSKISKNLLLYSILLIIILIVLHFILKAFDLKLREWIYMVVISISAILFVVFLIKKFIQKDKKTKLDILFGIMIFLVLCAIFWKFLLIGFFFLIVAIDANSEYVVERENVKYVAVVDTGFPDNDTNVYFHEYINPFVYNSKVEFSEFYEGAFDPTEIEEEEVTQNPLEENIIKVEEEKDSDEFIEGNIIKEEDILYEKEIRTGTIIKVINEGSVLGGKMVISVKKTDDSGKTWRNQLKTSDGYMTVNRGAKFVFINEEVGFINNLSLFVLGEDNDSLLVTVDGGESYKNANFIFPLDIEDTTFYVDGVPYKENNKLKVKMYSPAYRSDDKVNYYEFVSVDNGLNWEMCNEY